MHLKQRILILSLSLLLLGVVFVVPVGVSTASAFSTASTPAASSSFTAIPISGTATQAGRVIGKFTGTLSVTKFVTKSEGLLANSNLTGTLTNTASGQKTDISNAPVSAPAAVASATCQILNLVLGPLHLNLLGLVVDLNRVHLHITAQQAPGNLLGNLLCAITNLLNTGGPLSGLSSLLNQVLSIVG